MRYLEFRSTEVGQAQLNKDRQAIQSIIGERLPVLKSEVESIRGSRLYSQEQLAMVQEHQSPRHALATALVAATGIRSHELLSVMPSAEQPRSNHRTWSPKLHDGLSGQCYTVVGKGGLTREIVLEGLAALLEAVRLDSPRLVVDRGVRYTSHYDIGGGQAWSQSFTAASKRALGWTAGGHAIRATWACNRVEQLQRMGYGMEAAKAVCSQNLGHFSPATLDYYLER
jgi:integrase